MKKIPTLLRIAACAFSASADAAAQSAVVSTDGNGAVVVVPEVPAGGTQTVTVQVETKSPEPASPAIKAALIMQNHAAGDYSKYLGGLADALSAVLSKKGFAVINPENVIGAAQNKSNKGEESPKASAVRLCQDLGADCLITASITSVEKAPIGAPAIAYRLQIRIAINVANGSDGSVVSGETITIASDKPISKAQANDDDAMRFAFDSLLNSAAQKCAALVSAPKVMDAFAKMVAVSFACNISGATILVDGAAMGTAPSTIKMLPGLHNLEVVYPFCVPYKVSARFADGQAYNVNLELNDDGIARWEDNEKFIATMARMKDAGATDDYVQRAMADGRSDMLKNSHFRWNGASKTLIIERDGLAPLMLGPEGSVKTMIDVNNNINMKQD